MTFRFICLDIHKAKVDHPGTAHATQYFKGHILFWPLSLRKESCSLWRWWRGVENLVLNFEYQSESGIPRHILVDQSSCQILINPPLVKDWSVFFLSSRLETAPLVSLYKGPNHVKEFWRPKKTSLEMERIKHYIFVLFPFFLSASLVKCASWCKRVSD